MDFTIYYVRQVHSITPISSSYSTWNYRIIIMQIFLSKYGHVYKMNSMWFCCINVGDWDMGILRLLLCKWVSVMQILIGYAYRKWICLRSDLVADPPPVVGHGRPGAVQKPHSFVHPGFVCRHCCLWYIKYVWSWGFFATLNSQFYFCSRFYV